MKSFCALLALMATSVRANDVVVATDATFDEVIASSDLVLMEFYAPWCGHCKKLDPEWNSASTVVKGKAVLAKLDATVEKVSAEKYGVKGFPTIKIFREGKLGDDYTGGRTHDTIVAWVKGNSGPAVNVLESEEAVTAFLAENNVVAIANLVDAAAIEKFEKAAKTLRGGKVMFASASSEVSDIKADTVIVKLAGEEDFVFDDFSKDLADFITTNSVPIFDEIGPDNYKMYMDRKQPMSWLFCKPDDKASQAAAKGAAAEFKGKISFIWCDADKHAQMAEKMGLSKTVFPSMAIDDEGEQFHFSGDFETAKIADFTKKFQAGELTKNLKSAAEPAEHTVNGLTTVVGTTFDALISNSKDDVLIKFYAPWCGHCKTLAPIWDEVAEELKDKPIVIAKLDATENGHDAKKFKVEGFPTLYFMPADTKEAVVFSGGRTKDAILEYLNKNVKALSA